MRFLGWIFVLLLLPLVVAALFLLAAVLVFCLYAGWEAWSFLNGVPETPGRDKVVDIEPGSTLAGVAFSPALFDYLSIPVYDAAGTLVRAEVIPHSVSFMLALSTLVAAFSWGGLKAAHTVWLKYVKAWLERIFGKGPGT